MSAKPTVRVDEHGERHYHLTHAHGGGQGPAWWSDCNDVNPVCGCHLASLCRDCNCCTWCAGCYCREDDS